MNDPIFKSPGGVTLIGGGSCESGDMDMALQYAPDLIAADGGGDRALSFGLYPRAVIGDMDSLSAQARSTLGPDRLHHVAEQDSTDFGKCLRMVEAAFFLALGFTGKRIDHTLAALSQIATDRYPPVLLIGRDDVIFRALPEMEFHLPTATRFSLYPMGPVTGRSTGLRWPIDGLEFSPDGQIGTSNETVGPVTLSITGNCLILLPKDRIHAAMQGLGLITRDQDEAHRV